MSHLTTVKLKHSNIELIKQALEGFKNVKNVVQKEQGITFSVWMYGRDWDSSFTRQKDGTYTYSGESAFYPKFNRAYMKAQINASMNSLIEQAGSIAEKVETDNGITFKTTLGKTINFIIDGEDDIKVKTEGFEGRNCLTATTQLMTALGTITKQEMTNEGVDPDAGASYNTVQY